MGPKKATPVASYVAAAASKTRATPWRGSGGWLMAHGPGAAAVPVKASGVPGRPPPRPHAPRVLIKQEWSTRRSSGARDRRPTVKALVKAQAGPGLELRDVPEPVPRAGEVLIRVLRTGICGTDLHICEWDAWAQRTLKPPLVIGHEFVGPDRRDRRRRRRRRRRRPGRAARATSSAAQCRNCRAGRRHLCPQHRRRRRQPRRRLRRVRRALPGDQRLAAPDADPDPDVAAIFDPFGNAVHSALSFPVLGEDVLITGAGPDRHHGRGRRPARGRAARRDHRRQRRTGSSLARTHGRHAARSTSRTADLAEAIGELGMHEGFDVGLEMSGNAGGACASMLDNMTHGGRIALLGLPAGRDRHRLGPGDLQRCSRIKGIYGREMFETWYTMTVLHRGRARHLARDHAPLPVRRVRGGVRRRGAPGSAARWSSTGRRPGRCPTMLASLRAELRRPARRDARAPACCEAASACSSTPQGTHVARRRRPRRCSTSAPTTTSAWPTTRDVVAAAHAALDALGLRHGLGALHLRHADGAHASSRSALSAFLGTEDTILYSLLLRRQRRPLRDAARRARTRSSPTR